MVSSEELDMLTQDWLSRICYNYNVGNPFNPGILRLWGRCLIEDDSDALGCIIMGGEL